MDRTDGERVEPSLARDAVIGVEAVTAGEPIDRQIGLRLRAARVARNLSQGEVGRRVNLSFQQIQKYESGQSRVAAAKLCELARALDVPVSFFFGCDEMSESGADGSGMALSRDAWAMAVTFDKIRNAQTRKKVLDLVKTLAAE